MTLRWSSRRGIKKQRRRREEFPTGVLIGFNINWPKYLFHVVSLSRANASEKNRLAASVNTEYIQIVLHRREEKTLKREREKYTLSKG